MGRLANYVAEGKAALLVVDQVEDLAAMHRARLSTVLGMLKALAARTGAAVIALAHNPARNYPRAVTAMQNRLALASVVFTTAVVGPGDRRFLVPLRPAMSDDAPAIPFVLPPPSSFPRFSAQPRSPTGRSPVIPAQAGTSRPHLALGERSARDSAAGEGSPVIPAEAGIQSGPQGNFPLAWRKPVFPAHIEALAQPRPNDGAKTRAAQSFLMRTLGDGPRPAADVEREAALIGALQGQGVPRRHPRDPQRCRRMVLVSSIRRHFATG